MVKILIDNSIIRDAEFSQTDQMTQALNWGGQTHEYTLPGYRKRAVREDQGGWRQRQIECLPTIGRLIRFAVAATRQGKPYIDERGKCNAFDSLWQRFMDKVLANTKVTDRFQERDLRAKVATDSDTLLEASERLGHSDTGITQRVYRRKPVLIEPQKKGRDT